MSCVSRNINCVFSDPRETVESPESEESMLWVIVSLNEEKNGSFLDYDQETITW